MRRRATGENESGMRPRVSPDTPTMGGASGPMPAVVVPAIEPVAPALVAVAATPAPRSKRPMLVGVVALAVIVLGLIALFAGVFDSGPGPVATPEPQPAVAPPQRAPDPEAPAAVQRTEPAPPVDPVATPDLAPAPSAAPEPPHATPRRTRATGAAATGTDPAPTKRARGRRAASLSADEF